MTPYLTNFAMLALLMSAAFKTIKYEKMKVINGGFLNLVQATNQHQLTLHFFLGCHRYFISQYSKNISVAPYPNRGSY